MAERNLQPTRSRQSWSGVLSNLSSVEHVLGDIYADKGIPLKRRMEIKHARMNVLDRMNKVRMLLGEYDYACATASPIGWDF